MGQFLYYFPGVSGVDDDAIGKAELRPVFDGVPYATRRVSGGPDGRDGTIVASALGCQPEPRFSKDTQEWRECGAFWLGWERDAMPSPDDLARDTMIGGYQIRLGDERDWMIPVGRLDNGAVHNTLPQSIRLDAKGKRYFETLPKHAKLIACAAQAYAGLCHTLLGEGEPVVVDEQFKWTACIEALSTNYRVTQWEVATLGLLTTQNMDLVLACLCDFQSYARMRTSQSEAAKKNGRALTGDTSNTSGGSADLPADTNQPSQTLRCSVAA